MDIPQTFVAMKKSDIHQTQRTANMLIILGYVNNYGKNLIYKIFGTQLYLNGSLAIGHRWYK